jgi:hypothetical protein
MFPISGQLRPADGQGGPGELGRMALAAVLLAALGALVLAAALR